MGFRDSETDILHVVCDQVRRGAKRVLTSTRISDVH